MKVFAVSQEYLNKKVNFSNNNRSSISFVVNLP